VAGSCDSQSCHRERTAAAAAAFSRAEAAGCDALKKAE
jgi:hypothetical protein